MSSYGVVRLGRVASLTMTSFNRLHIQGFTRFVQNLTMRGSLLCLLIFGVTTVAQQAPSASGTQAIYQAEARSAQRKFDYIQQNALRKPPNPKPTTITENEINAWLSSGNAQLPKGVKKLQLHGEGGRISGHAVVDFDEITAGKSLNPLLSLFHGVHDVEAEGRAEGNGGEGHVHIETVSLDGVEIPHMALEYFVEKYVTPKYPGVGLDSTFKLQYRIDVALIGARQVTVMQR